ncbi:MAG: hypothetical protein U0169_21585 [Polyangiaceae bacterium]
MPMRTRLLTVLALGSVVVSATLVAACTTLPRREVFRNSLGAVSTIEQGTPLTLKRWELVGPRPKDGFHVVKNPDDWRLLFPNPAQGSYPALPRSFNFSKEMVVMAAGGEDAEDLEVRAVVYTDTTLHVYLTETVPGKGCPKPNRAQPIVDVRFTERVDRDTMFHLDSIRGKPCAAPLGAEIACKIQSKGTATSPLVAELGDVVACSAVKNKEPGAIPIIERTWNLAESPEGSTSKLTIAEGSRDVTFPIDTFGQYSVRYQQEDEASRTTMGGAIVQAVPPTGAFVAELAWTKFDPQDDPSTFPRVELHAVDVRTQREPFEGRGFLGDGRLDCATEGAPRPSWCSAQKSTASAFVKVPHKDGKFHAYVKYVDDRFYGAPVACVKLFHDGKGTDKVCDPTVRKAGSVWDAGAFDLATGEFEATKAKRVAAEKAAAEKAAAEKAAADKALADKVAAEKAEAERREAEKAETSDKRDAGPAPRKSDVVELDTPPTSTARPPSKK